MCTDSLSLPENKNYAGRLRLFSLPQCRRLNAFRSAEAFQAVCIWKQTAFFHDARFGKTHSPLEVCI